MLDVQVQILSVDTGDFYFDDEAALHEENRVVRTDRRKLINGCDEKLESGEKVHIKGTKEIEQEFRDLYGVDVKELHRLYKQYKSDFNCINCTEALTSVGIDLSDPNISADCYELFDLYLLTQDTVNSMAEKAKMTKTSLLSLFEQRVQFNESHPESERRIRELRHDNLYGEDGKFLDNKVISVFDSSLTRMVGAEPNKLSLEFMVVQVYYFDVIKDLIYHGFNFNGERYVYFTSSAGQIRTKKCVFIKESTLKKYEKTIMCGLTLDDINAKGGNNPNKHLAYMALLNSATDEWVEFDIDKTIVIDDFETQVFGEYELVDDMDYSVTRKSGYMPIPHTDGCGMILPGAFGSAQKNKMVRLPWIKGLLGVFDYRKFIEVNHCSPYIEDIYGVVHHVIDEDIQIIFTKSQFKLWKYYDSYEQYKSFFKQYGCTAGFTNEEEDKIRNATINYQMLQSLTDITDEEIEKIAGESVHRLGTICSDIEDVQRAFGATLYNENQTAFQKAITLYPQLLNDSFVKQKLKEIKDSMRKKYRAGKLQVDGKYTFILPDLYAACEYWFGGVKEPVGLLADGEVFCWLFRKADKLDCLRSPHLYREHAVRRNLAYKGDPDTQRRVREWFCTDALYTSTHDLISKFLMFDVDGDKSLVVADKTLVQVAERNMQGIVPLYYNMKKAAPRILDNASIYAGLSSAFTGSNIGMYSNNITKIWNHPVFVNGTDEERANALLAIKLLCMENNFKIDYAKTLYMPERPPYEKELITHYTKDNVPNFFLFAKDKNEDQVEQPNSSFVNKIGALIPNPRLSYRYIDGGGKSRRLSKPDAFYMLSDKYFVLSEEHEKVIEKYVELSKQYAHKVDLSVYSRLNGNELKNSQARQIAVYGRTVERVKSELAEFGYSESVIADILVSFLYKRDPNKKCKDLLWICYGDLIYENLKKNSENRKYASEFRAQERLVQCVDCGEWFYVSNRDRRTCRCKTCQADFRRETIRLAVQRNREKPQCKQIK